MEKRAVRVGGKLVEFWHKTDSDIAANKTIHDKPHLHHWTLFESAAIFLIILFTWLIGVTQLRTYKLNNQKLSASVSEQKLREAIGKQAEEFSLTLVNPEGEKEVYGLTEMGVTVDAPASASASKKASGERKNLLLWWRPVQLRLVTTTDQTKLADFMKTHGSREVTPAKNALLAINPDGTIATSPESTGVSYGIAGGKQTVVDAIANLNSQTLTLTKREVRPSITSKSTASAKDNLQKTLDQKITVSINGKAVQPDAHDIGAWLVLTPNEKKQTYELTVDNGKVKDYVNKVASANIRRTRDQVEVTHPDGSTSVLVRGVEGVDVNNKDAVVADISKQALQHNGFDITLDVKKTPFKVVSTVGGNKLLEVDTTTKRMYAFENGVLVRTFLISAGAPATPTVTGTFSIFSKVRIQDMRGSNADGSKYLQPDVEYVNYFYRDYAVHGNYWRPVSYFGNVNSSHGCVGIVNSDAEWIYGWAPIGTSVVVHT